jgi:hypothetical protein
VGASACEPRILLKIVLLAYSHGIVSSRGMEWAGRNNVQFIALSGDSQPDHSTLATFVSSLGEAVAKVFTQVLMICQEPVFGNLRANKQLNRFTLRGRSKVEAQSKLYCLVHKIEKLAHNGYAR